MSTTSRLTGLKATTILKGPQGHFKINAGTAADGGSSDGLEQSMRGVARGEGGGRKIGRCEEPLLPWCAESISSVVLSPVLKLLT